MLGFPKDMFYMADGRYNIIMVHLKETDGTFGYFYMESEEDKSLAHYNNVVERKKAEGSKDQVLYLEGCRVMNNPELINREIPYTLRIIMETMTDEELEGVIGAARKIMCDKRVKRWEQKEEKVNDENLINPFL